MTLRYPQDRGVYHSPRGCQRDRPIPCEVIFQPSGGKPKGMRGRNYWRLKAKHNNWVMVSLEVMAARLGLVMQTLGAIEQRMAKRQ